VVVALGNLGHALARQGSLDEASRLQCEALAIAHAQLDLGGIADTLIEAAALALAHHRYEEAAVMLGASSAIHEDAQSVLDVVTEKMYEEGLSQLRHELGAEALASAMALGRNMSLDDVVALTVSSLD
jgi:hypothetical protein